MTSIERPRATSESLEDTGGLYPDIAQRLLNGPPAGLNYGAQDALSSELRALAADKSRDTFERRREALSVLHRLSAGLDSEGYYKKYGNDVVLRNLENMQVTSLSPENMKARSATFDSFRGELFGGLETPLAKAYDGDGMSMPRTPEEIKDHPYFYIDPNMKIMRVRVDFIDRDKKLLSGVVPPAAAQFIQEHIAILDEMAAADPLDVLKNSPEKYALSSLDKNAIKSIKSLLGLTAAGFAVVSGFMEKDQDFPVFTLAYAGLATLLLKPKILSGKLRTIRGQLDFLHDKKGRWDMLTTKYKGQLTGEAGAKFFREMTQERSIRMLYAKTKLTKGRMSLPEYYKELKDQGVSQHHIDFLEGLSKSERFFLLNKLQGVQSTDAQDLLVEFARRGLNVDSFARLPGPRERPKEPQPYAARAEELDGYLQERDWINPRFADEE